MSKLEFDCLNYLIAFVSEFAGAHGMSAQEAYLYLSRYKGLDFVEEFYDVEHTMSFEEAVKDVGVYCRRMGGELI